MVYKVPSGMKKTVVNAILHGNSLVPAVQEKGQKAARFGRAVLGILLLQDIAVVPLLVLLPIIETQGGTETALSEQLLLVGMTVAKGVGGLGGILVAGRFLLRPLFDVVAGEKETGGGEG